MSPHSAPSSASPSSASPASSVAASSAPGSDTKRNLFWLTAASGLQVVIQFLIQVVLAYQFGAKADVDALTSALVIPTVLAAIISGSLSYVLVPDLVASFRQSHTVANGWKVATLVGLITGLIGWLATLLVLNGSPAIIGWLYGHMPIDKQHLAARLLTILSWQISLSTAISWSLAVHHSRHSFIVPAMGGVWGTLATLLLALLWGHQGIPTIAIAINVGSLISAIIHLYPLVFHLRLGAVPGGQFRRLLWALLPLVVGSLYLRIDPIVDRSLASRLDEGTVAHLHYAQRIIVALLAISTSGLAVIAFPQLAGHLAASGQRAFAQHFALAMRRLIFIVVPIAIGFGLYAVPVITDLLQRGQFGARDSAAVGGLILCFMGMFIGASWGELLARGFYTLGDTRTPTIVGVVTITIGFVAKWFSLPQLGVVGIALSTSLSLLLSAAVMSILLARKTEGRILEGSWLSLALATSASLVACAACTLPYTLSIGRTWLAAPIGAGLYLTILALIIKWKPTIALDRQEPQAHP